MKGRVVLPVALACALVACGTKDIARVPGSADVLVSVGDGAITAPDSVAPGWARVRVEEHDGSHIVVAFRLPATSSDADIKSFLVALDTAATTPSPGIAVGGPEIGAVGEVIIHFAPGRYVLGCVSRGRDEHRHAGTGEFKVVDVAQGTADSARATPPVETQTVRMIDFAYGATEKWTAGSHLVRVENNGQQDHQFRLVKLRAGSSLKDWMLADDPNTVSTPVAGVARIGATEVAYLPVELSAGDYVAYCLISDRATRRLHVELGMLRPIRVD